MRRVQYGDGWSDNAGALRYQHEPASKVKGEELWDELSVRRERGWVYVALSLTIVRAEWILDELMRISIEVRAQEEEEERIMIDSR